MLFLFQAQIASNFRGENLPKACFLKDTLDAEAFCFWREDPMSLLNRKAVKEFIKEHGKYISQIETTFWSALEMKVERLLLNAISNNASRRRLTQYELMTDRIPGKKGGEPVELLTGQRPERRLQDGE